MQQVLRNVLASAIKFSPEGSTVAVGQAMDAQGEALLWVRDSGPGIPQAELEDIFGAFVQRSRTPRTARAAPGWGWPSAAPLCRPTAARSAPPTGLKAAPSS